MSQRGRGDARPEIEKSSPVHRPQPGAFAPLEGEVGTCVVRQQSGNHRGTTLFLFPQWIAHPRPFGAGPGEAVNHGRSGREVSNEGFAGVRKAGLRRLRASQMKHLASAVRLGIVGACRAPVVPRPPTRSSLYQAALTYLARYAATEAGLRRVLTRQVERWARTQTDPEVAAPVVEAAREAIEAVIGRLVEAGAVSDTAFAENRARSLVRGGQSNRAVQARLIAKGVSPEVARAASASDAETELAAALVLARKRRIGPYRTKEGADRCGPDEGNGVAGAGRVLAGDRGTGAGYGTRGRGRADFRAAAVGRGASGQEGFRVHALGGAARGNRPEYWTFGMYPKCLAAP